MKATKAAYRYAQSLIQLASEQGGVEQVKADMETVANTVNASHDLELMLQSPIIKPATKRSVLKKVFGESISELALQFILLITAKGRESILSQIAEAFITLYNKQEGIVTAEVTSAAALSDEELSELKKSLSSVGKTIEIKEQVDPKILGGIKIKVGDQLIDASIRRKLNDIKVDIFKHKLSAI